MAKNDPTPAAEQEPVAELGDDAQAGAEARLEQLDLAQVEADNYARAHQPSPIKEE